MSEVTLKKTISRPNLSQTLEEIEDDIKPLTWKDYLITEEPADIPPIILIKDVPLCTLNNHSLIVGKKKSRKSLLLVWLLWQFMKQGGSADGVLVCDTEQGKKHVWKNRDRIYRLTGKHVNTLSLRGVDPKERKRLIEEAAQEKNYSIIIIDGVRDLLGNINDPDQCTELITWIEHITVKHGVHIINVLHLNKVDNNARGHIGSELLNKAEVTIMLELDEKAGCTVVKCESSRDLPFESFAFTHSSEGLPELISVPIKGNAMTDLQRKELLSFAFDGRQLKYAELIESVKSHFTCGTNKAGSLLSEFIRLGWVIKNGPDRNPETVYKIMV